ncbi:MAG: DPP IV N-terminal domain-containing protein [bacterium]|nr:DPP IV N-terminal domain-containing protein [bacterium]
MRAGLARALTAALVLMSLLTPGEMSPAQAQSAQAQSQVELCDPGSVEQFTDVEPGDYGAAYILCMRALGLSVGTGGGRYGPDQVLNRGQMATFLVRLWHDVLGRQCPEGGSPFTDVSAGGTHSEDIECLYNLGVTAGVTPTTYGPQLPLRASQVTRFLLRVYRNAGDCPDTAGTGRSELEEAVTCLTGLRVLPPGEGGGSGSITRARAGVYLIGLWHILSGRGLPPPPPTVPRLHIAYSSCHLGERFECSDIGLIGVDGTDHRQVPTTGWLPQSIDTYPAWSPDGATIAYNAGGEIWLVEADGTDHRRLTTTGYASSSFAWSPDSSMIVYYGYEDGTGLWVINSDGTDNRQLTTARHFGPSFAWSPDGTRIAYRVYYGREDGAALWVINSDGTGNRELTTTGHGAPWFAWSPDGTRIVYSSYDRNSMEAGLRVIEADGSDERLLATLRNVGYADWSPDGSRIVYSGYDRTAEEGGLWVIDADGTDGRLLAAARGYILDLDWSPDGAKIAYSLWQPGNSTWIRVIEADGTGDRQLVGTRLSPEDPLLFMWLRFFTAPMAPRP